MVDSQKTDETIHARMASHIFWSFDRSRLFAYGATRLGVKGSNRPEGENRMDYRKLLIKYIDHVATCEGVTFLSPTWNGDLVAHFSAEEITELRLLEATEVDDGG